jgi:hypothetical protein
VTPKVPCYLQKVLSPKPVLRLIFSEEFPFADP